MRNLYDILGVSPRSTAGDIKAAFRKQAREKHPDANQGTQKAEDAFKELNRAYAILSTPDQRSLYDRGEIDGSGTPINTNKHKKGRPFEDFIRRRKRDKPNTSGTIKIQGTDVSYSLKIEFMEAMHGATKHVSMTNGKRLRVSIPPGTRHNQTLRLKGQGMGGVGGGTDGDALVEILVEKHDLFDVEGNNIVMDFPISLSEAVLGGQLEAPTIDGPVKMTVPANADSGTILRLRGKGPRNGTGQRGDQLTRLQIMLPEQGDPELTKFVQSWKATPARKTKKPGARSD